MVFDDEWEQNLYATHSAFLCYNNNTPRGHDDAATAEECINQEEREVQMHEQNMVQCPGIMLSYLIQNTFWKMQVESRQEPNKINRDLTDLKR